MSEGGVCQKKLLFYIVWQEMGIGKFSLSRDQKEQRAGQTSGGTVSRQNEQQR